MVATASIYLGNHLKPWLQLPDEIDDFEANFNPFNISSIGVELLFMLCYISCFPSLLIA